MLIVTAAMVMEHHKLLITKRLSHDIGPDKGGGLWEFPGGKVEHGETPREALAREMREELHLSVAVGPIYDVIHHRYPVKEVLLLIYLCRIVEGDPVPGEGVAEYVMAPLSSLARYEFLDADRELAEWIASHPDDYCQDCNQRWAAFAQRQGA